jgi:hypothetical protein
VVATDCILPVAQPAADVSSMVADGRLGQRRSTYFSVSSMFSPVSSVIWCDTGTQRLMSNGVGSESALPAHGRSGSAKNDLSD